VNGLREFSRRVAALELVPYHSGSFAGHRLIECLPSTAQVLKFAQNELLPRVCVGDAVAVVTRQATAWGLGSERTPNLVCYERGLARGASLSPRSPGGKLILRHLLNRSI
jgi:hypothetical protein